MSGTAAGSVQRASPRIGPGVDGVLFGVDCVVQGAGVRASAVGLARRLRAQGYAVAAFSDDPDAARVLASVGLSDLFPVCVDGTVAERLGLPARPAPDVLLEAARRVGVAPARTVVVEAAQEGVEAARRGGFASTVGLDAGAAHEPLLAAGADAVVRDLSEVRVEPHVPPSALENVEAILSEGGDRRLALFLDFDGTLAPIVDRPEQALLDPATRRVVARLAAVVPVAVVSGRDRDVVARMVGVPEVRCAGSHGLDVEGAQVPVDGEAMAAVDQAEAILRKRLTGVRGALVERKRYTVAAHVRLVSDSDLPRVEAAVNEALHATSGLRRAEGKKVVELRPDVDWDKGHAVRHLVEAVGAPETVWPVYVGDDATDEDAFQALRGHGVGVAVLDEARATNARFLLRDCREVRTFLERLALAVGA